MSDTIFVHGLVLHAYHGVMPHEAKVGQPFILDLILELDLSRAARSDRVGDTVSYDQVVATASKAFCAQRCKLIEAAGAIAADAILGRFPDVERVTVTVHKPHAPVAATFKDVGVTLTRTRNG
jgi:dihydroneopterin aldolase